ncbi:MAG: hypothetical protein HYU66_13020 [Armatimonadetes bacterium]|nr:hypothetical protein [Armatimonadota bacterium]
MRAFLLAFLGFAVCAGAPVGAIESPQQVESFPRAAADGRPAGWDVVAFGAEATIAHDAGTPHSLKLNYRFTAADGAIYLLRFARLRTKPVGVELTVRGDAGGQVLGILLRDAKDGDVLEYRTATPLRETGWIARTIECKQPAARNTVGNGTLDGLKGGGGTALEAVVVRRGPNSPESGVLQLAEIIATCEVEPEQTTMLDIVGDRLDGVYVQGEAPHLEMTVVGVTEGEKTIDLQYTVKDSEGRTAGQGRQPVKVASGNQVRVPVELTSPDRLGQFTVRASAKAGNSERFATQRFCLVPKVPAGRGRRLGVGVVPLLSDTESWFDYIVFQMLQRAGAACARVELRWADVEAQRGQRKWTAFDHLVDCSKRSGLPLLVSACDPPAWVRRGGMGIGQTGFADFLGAAAMRARDQVMGWQVWREPNTTRFWPPKPQPLGYRALLEASAKQLVVGANPPVVVNGSLRGFEAGYCGALLSGTPATPYLAFTLRVPRYAFPLPANVRPPSAEMNEVGDKERAWARDTGRPPLSLWFTDVGVRTSPVETSQPAQAQELAKCVGQLQGGGSMLFWYRAADGTEETDRFGLIRRDLEPKPALAALAAGAVKVGELPGRRPEWLAFAGPLVRVRPVYTDLWGNPVADAARAVWTRMAAAN